MPEGPEARLILDKLRTRLKGKILIDIIVFDRMKNYELIKERYNLAKNCFPSKILDIITVGKQIYFYLENKLILNSGLGMSGIWLHNQKLNHTSLILNIGKIEDRFCIVEDELYFNDISKRGNFYILTPYEVNDKISKNYRNDLMNVIKPQNDIHHEVVKLLSKTFFDIIDKSKFYEILKTSSLKKPDQHINEWLLDQKNISGIGNYIKSECLYLAHISPFRKISSLNINEVYYLFDSILYIMKKSYDSGGLTIGDFYDPDYKKGSYETLVYGKVGKLDMYGHPIQKLVGNNQRTTFWVPNVQL